MYKYYSCNVYCRARGDFGSVHRYGAIQYGWYGAVRNSTVGTIRYGTVRNGTIGMVRSETVRLIQYFTKGRRCRKERYGKTSTLRKVAMFCGICGAVVRCGAVRFDTMQSDELR